MHRIRDATLIKRSWRFYINERILLMVKYLVELGYVNIPTT